MQERVRVCVIVPVRNRRRLVIEALESINNQTTLPAKLIVVDDGSDDGTDSAVMEYFSSCAIAETVLIRQRKAGAASARNAGLEQAGDCAYVAFLDSDDLWPSSLISRALQAFSDNPDVVAVSTDIVRETSSTGGDDPRSAFVDTSSIASSPLAWLIWNEAGLLSCSVLRTQAVREVNGFPAEVHTGHDVRFFGRISQCGDWQHLPGEPVVKRYGLHARYAEMSHINSYFKAPHNRWAEAYEQLLLDLPRNVTRDAEIRRAMSWRWLVAARNAVRGGHFLKASHAAIRSAMWKLPIRLHSALSDAVDSVNSDRGQSA